MHTKGAGDTSGGSWTVRLGAVLLGLSIGWSLSGPSAAAAEGCGITIIGSCEDSQEPASTTTTTAAPMPAAPEPSSAQAAAQLLSLLNDERAGAGLAPFAIRADVTEIAAGWSAAMAQSAHLAHNDAYFTAETRTRLDARMLGENVARNPSVDGAHRALMASPPHRANILDGRFVVIGIAAELRDGSWWVTQDFLQPATGAAAAPARAAAVSAPAPAQLATPTTAPNPATVSPTSQPTTPAPTAEDDEGEVLAATASAPSVVDLSPGDTSEASRASAPPASSSTSSRTTVAVVAVTLLALALLAGYRMSCSSASARIRCR